MTRTITYDPVMNGLAYKVAFNITHDYVVTARQTGLTFDVERLREELGLVVDMGDENALAGFLDALAGLPSRERLQ